MFKSIAAAVIAATSLAYTAPSNAERLRVKGFDDTMKAFDRLYEVYTTTNDMGFELTLFRLMPATDAKARNGKVVHI
jgi:hypothetical protein